MNKNKIKIAITVDTDSDLYFGNKAAQYNASDKSIIGWNGLDKGMPILTDAINEFSDKHNINIPISWFVRCDRQIEEKYNNMFYILTFNLVLFHLLFYFLTFLKNYPS